MSRLLVLRLVPLLMRPAAVVLEGALLSDGYILILLMPVAMMALTISSIPVHLDYFRSHAGMAGHIRLGQIYSSAFSWLTLVSLMVLAGLLMVLPLGFSPLLISAICLTFLIEKLADETCRTLEFSKAFVKWFLVQSLRSGWFILPVGVSLTGADYGDSFLAFAGLILILMALAFLRVTGLRPRLGLDGMAEIGTNLVFLAGSLLSAGYVQLPRLLVAKLFPEQAHVYLATTQLCQGASLIFSVQYQIPYRKIIARRPKLFQRRMWPTMLRLLVPVVLTAILYLAGDASSLLAYPSRDIVQVALLLPILTADTLMLVVLSAHLGYLQWFVGKYSAFMTYLICIGTAGLWAALLVSSGLWQVLSLLAVPALTILTGAVWLFIVIMRYFRRSPLHG